EAVTVCVKPLMTPSAKRAKSRLARFCKMLKRVIQIYYLGGPPEMFRRYIPYPRRSVSDHDHLPGLPHSSANRFGINPSSELLGRFYGADVAGRLIVSDRSSLVIHCGLSEHTPELCLSAFGPSVCLLSFATLQLLRNYRHSSSIYCYVHP